MKVVIIGCTHAGTLVAATLKKVLGERVEVTVIEMNKTISFLSCGIAIGAQLDIPMEKMFYSSVQGLRDLGCIVYSGFRATRIDSQNKTVHIQDLEAPEKEQPVLQYDKLVLSTGSWPVIPPFCKDFLCFENVMLCKNYEHGKHIREMVNKYKRHGKRVAIIGAGYIGEELVETFVENQFNVTLVEGEDRIMKRYFDAATTSRVEEELKRRGVTLQLGQFMQSMSRNADTGVLTLRFPTQQIEVDMVVLCIGFKPNTDFILHDVPTLQNSRGAFQVDANSQTSIPGIYAIGDCACTFNPITEQYQYIPLATNAVRQATSAAAALIHEMQPDFPLAPSLGAIGTSSIKIFDQVLGSTGLTLVDAKAKFGDDATSCTVVDAPRPEFISPVHKHEVTIVFLKSSKLLLGVQMMSTYMSIETIQLAAALIMSKSTLQQVIMQDFCFNPWFDKPQTPLVAVCQHALLQVSCHERFTE